MKSKTMVRYAFKVWLILYQLENFIWKRYSHSFIKLNGGKDLPQYHQNQPCEENDIPF